MITYTFEFPLNWFKDLNDEYKMEGRLSQLQLVVDKDLNILEVNVVHLRPYRRKAKRVYDKRYRDLVRRLS